jgi:hypothetical protein
MIAAMAFAFEDGEVYDEEDEGHEKSTSSAQQDINAEEEAELWLSSTSLVSALSEASSMTLSPSSSFNASNRSWSIDNDLLDDSQGSRGYYVDDDNADYQLPFETSSLPPNWRYYPDHQDKVDSDSYIFDDDSATQRRGNSMHPECSGVVVPPLLCDVTT